MHGGRATSNPRGKNDRKIGQTAEAVTGSQRGTVFNRGGGNGLPRFSSTAAAITDIHCRRRRPQPLAERPHSAAPEGAWA